MSNAGDGSSDVTQSERRMTVAVVDEQAAHATVKFLESARIYRLPRTSADFASSLRALQAAVGTGVAVCVRLTAPHSEIIVSVRPNC
jgi:hypothetical protein